MSRVAVFSGPYDTSSHLHGLGDQIYDPVSGTYVDSLPASDNPVAPQFSPVAYNVPDVSYPSLSTFKPPNTITTASIPGIQPAVGVTQTPRPSPTVAVPLSTSSMGLWFTGSTFGMPNWAWGLGVVALGAVLIGGSGRRR